MLGPAGLPPGRARGTSIATSLVFLLSVIAGSTDTIGFLGLNGLFTAHITGNLVMLAAHLIARDADILSSILSVPVYMLILLLTRIFALALERRGVATLRPLLLLQLMLLVGFMTLCVAGPHDTSSPLIVLAGMLGVAAMAVQTALVQISLAGAPSTAVMTTNIAHFMVALGELLASGKRASAAWQRLVNLVRVILGFIAGCGLGAGLEGPYGLGALALPASLALLSVGLTCHPSHRPTP